MTLSEPSRTIEGSLRVWKRIFLETGAGGVEKVDGRLLFGLVVFGLLIRIPLVIFPEVIHNDGTAYIRHARQFLSGDWQIGRSHPFYPALIALAQFFSPNGEIAGILVSVIFGALIVLPVFCLGKAIFDERVGAVSALFATVHPILYISSGCVLTESTFHFLLATTVLFGWKAFHRGRVRDIILFGLFSTLSYLTRPEAIGFPLIFGAWVLLVHPPSGRREWTKRVVIMILAILSFLVFSFPYLLQLKKETGSWQISRKVSVSMGSFSEGEGNVPVGMIRTKKEVTLSSFVRSPFSVIRKMGIGFLQSLYRFQQVYTPLLSLLLIFGFILNRGKDLSIKGNLFLLSYLVYFLGFIHPFFWVTRRYTSHVISIALPWAAFGFIEITHWVRRRFEKEKFQKKLPAVLLILILAILFIQGGVIHSREHRVIQKEAGLWMRDHLTKGSRLMSSLPQEAFYGDMHWVRMPQGSYEEILQEARSKGVEYLIVDQKLERTLPDFLSRAKKGDLIWIKGWKKKDQRVILFQVTYPKGS